MLTSIRFNGFNKVDQSKQVGESRTQTAPNFKVSSDVVSFGNMEKLGEFVLKNSQRIEPVGDLKDAVNLTFFAVQKVGNPSVDEFKKLAQPVEKLIEKSKGGELSYLQLGGEMGDQGLALQTMGLGHLLGEWKVLSPDTVIPSLPQPIKLNMAGSGMVTITKAKS